ncbi:unnamed protein product, partial [Mesorhabditis belari]|uniref:Uncharacterized protein n=1 Tax=Mesorhabditis belari TaxID=2138241 RepID=A0AAF3FJ10_9BILA
MPAAGILISKDNSGIGLDIQNSFFVSNQGVYITIFNPEQEFFIENNTFANNTEFNAAPKSSLIDLIYTDSSAVRNFAITDNIFNGNTAKYIARVFEKDEEMSVSVLRKRHEIAKNHFNNNTGWSLIFASVALTDIFGNTFQSKEMKCDITTNEPRKPNWLDLQKNEFIAFPDNLKYFHVCATSFEGTITYPWEGHFRDITVTTTTTPPPPPVPPVTPAPPPPPPPAA